MPMSLPCTCQPTPVCVCVCGRARVPAVTVCVCVCVCVCQLCYRVCVRARVPAVIVCLCVCVPAVTVCLRVCMCWLYYRVYVCVCVRARAGCYRVSVRLCMCVRAHTRTCPQLTAARPRGRLRCGPEGPRGPCAVRDPRGGCSRGPQPSRGREVFQGVSQKQAQPGPPASGTMGPFSRPADGWPVAMTTSIVGRLSGRVPAPPTPPPGPAVWCVWRWQLLSKEGTSLSPGDERHLVFIAPFLSPDPAPRAPTPEGAPWPPPGAEVSVSSRLRPSRSTLPLPPTLGVPSSPTLECGVQTRSSLWASREPFPALLPEPRPASIAPQIQQHHLP